MRKVLLSVMMVSSLLAFNACKKGDQGPIGPVGPTGATGANGTPGAVGATGAKGADGTKILAGTVDPVATDGAVGDFYFNKTTKTLWGPKVAAGWAGTSTSLSGATGAAGVAGPTGPMGPTGPTGAMGPIGVTGAAGTSFLAGPGAGANGTGAPANNVGNVGDFYFNTTTSTFYGPKGTGATPWAGVNEFPLGSTFGAKTYHLVKGFDAVNQTAINKAQKIVETWGAYEIFTNYTVTADDKIRFDQYPGWGENREMIFESTPGSGIFDRVPRGAFDFVGSGVSVPSGYGSSYAIPAGAKFRYTKNISGVANAAGGTSSSTAEFTLTSEDIARLSVNNGAAFAYLTYAKALQSTVAVGQTLTFARTKNIGLADDDANYYAEYTATTSFNLNTIVPKLEKYKKEGAYVFVGYTYFANKAGSNAKQNYYGAGSERGYVNITPHVLSYVNANVAYGDQNQYNTGAGNIITTNPFSVSHGAVGTTNNGMAGAFGQSVITLAANQIATPRSSGTGAFSYSNGNLSVTWDIKSGVKKATKDNLSIDPLTLTNPTNDLDVVTNGTWVSRTYNRDYYSGAQLTTSPGVVVNNSPTSVTFIPQLNPFLPNFPGYYQTITGTTSVEAWTHTGGQPATYFSGHKLLHLTINVIPAEIVAQAKAKGVNVNDLGALQNFANSL